MRSEATLEKVDLKLQNNVSVRALLEEVFNDTYLTQFEIRFTYSILSVCACKIKCSSGRQMRCQIDAECNLAFHIFQAPLSFGWGLFFQGSIT